MSEKQKQNLTVFVQCEISIKHAERNVKHSIRLKNSFRTDVPLKRYIKKKKFLTMLFATVTRFIASRNAVKTIYWRTIEEGDSVRIVKHTKTINFEAPATQTRNTQY